MWLSPQIGSISNLSSGRTSEPTFLSKTGSPLMPWHTNESVPRLVVSASPLLTGKLIFIIQQGRKCWVVYHWFISFSQIKDKHNYSHKLLWQSLKIIGVKMDAFRKTWPYRIFFWGNRPKRRLTLCPLLACPLCFSHKKLLLVYNHSWSFPSMWLCIEYSKPWYILWIFFCRVIEWMWKWKSLNHIRLFATPWNIQSMEFSRPEYWSG